MIPHQQYCLYCKLKRDLDNELHNLREFSGNLAVQRLVSNDIAELRRQISAMEPCTHRRPGKLPNSKIEK